jgi:hypothetical protein
VAAHAPWCGIGAEPKPAELDVWTQEELDNAKAYAKRIKADLFSDEPHPAEPTMTSSAIKTLGRLLNMPADELKAKIDAHEETGLGELVVNAIQPKPAPEPVWTANGVCANIARMSKESDAEYELPPNKPHPAEPQREWWITDDGLPTFECVVSNRPLFANSVKVVEHSRLLAAEAKLEIAVAALRKMRDIRCAWRLSQEIAGEALAEINK